MKDKLPALVTLNTWINRELEHLNPSFPQSVVRQIDAHRNQEEHPTGLAIEMSQQHDFKNVQIMADHHITKGLGVWAPVICNTQAEADYLHGLALMLGAKTDDMIFVRGITEGEIGKHYGIDTPSTYVRIPHLELDL